MAEANAVTKIDGAKKRGLMDKFAGKYDVDPTKMMETLKSTAFKQRDGSAPTNEQMMALVLVADQHNLNPFTKEIYAFPGKSNGIVPVVGVDGWSRIINSHPEFDGMEFHYSEEMVTPRGARSDCHVWCECSMYRKDRTRPITAREYLDEVYREPFKAGMQGPWQTHPKRFLRHKAMIQCARIAFGFSGIYDQDEADRIRESQQAEEGTTEQARPERPIYPDADFQKNLDSWRSLIESGKRTPDDIIAMVESKYALTDEQRQQIKDLGAIEAETTEGSEA